MSDKNDRELNFCRDVEILFDEFMELIDEKCSDHNVAMKVYSSKPSDYREMFFGLTEDEEKGFELKVWIGGHHTKCPEWM